MRSRGLAALMEAPEIIRRSSSLRLLALAARKTL